MAHTIRDRSLDLLSVADPKLLRLRRYANFAVQVRRRICLTSIDVLDREHRRLGLIVALFDMTLNLLLQHLPAAPAHDLSAFKNLLDAFGRLPEVLEVSAAVLALFLQLLLRAGLAVKLHAFAIRA